MKMKKAITVLLIAAIAAASLAGCGRNGENVSSNPPQSENSSRAEISAPGESSNEPTSEPEEESSEPEVQLPASETLSRYFDKIVSEHPDADGVQLANYVVMHPFLDTSLCEQATWNYMKFIQPTTGFREGAELPEYKHFTQIDCSELGSPFVCYIFELNEGTDAESFMAAVRENADGGFASEQYVSGTGKWVFFVSCGDDIRKNAPATDELTAIQIMKRVRVEAGLSMNIRTESVSGDDRGYFFGIKENAALVDDSGVVCEPDMGAFSVVIVKVKNSGDVEKVRSEMEKGLDPGRAICMIADAACAVAKGDYIIGVIGTEDECKTIPEIFANIVK